jgi:undecaprenyl-diphosphatase
MLTRAADRSVLWMGIAGTLAVFGGPSGRRAARAGLVSVGVTSALANLVMKFASGRVRPDRDAAGVPGDRHVPMPRTSSFPSGHSASAFAFATAVGGELPFLALPLRGAATAVAYSRVHSGVHYPGDTIAGAALGSVTALVVSRVMRGRGAGRAPAG